MITKVVTPHQPVLALVTGHFQSGSGYYAYRPQGTDDYLMIYTLAGLGRFRMPDQRQYLCRPHEIILCAPGTYQDYGVEESLSYWDLLWTHFRPRTDWLDLLGWPVLESGLMKLEVPEGPSRHQIVQQFYRVHELALSIGDLRDRLAMNALEGLLLMCEQINPDRANHRSDHRIRQVMDEITRRLSQRITLESLADLAGLSPSRFGHLFQEIVGISPMDFVERQRIERSKQLLAVTSLSIKEISRHVGYDNPFYFSLRFKKRVGVSPKAYRDSLI